MKKSLILLVGSAFMLNACVPVAIFSAATVVGASAAEERGIGSVASDSTILTQINGSWLAHDPKLNQNIEAQVREGRVVLSGTVDSVQQQIDAVRLVWKIRGVKEVIDETEVGKGTGFGGYASDSWISTRIKTQMLFDPDISSINYNVKTVNGKVYLMGIAQDNTELAKVTKIAKGTPGVKKIINYVRLKGQAKSYGGSSSTVEDVSSDRGETTEGEAIEVKTIN